MQLFKYYSWIILICLISCQTATSTNTDKDLDPIQNAQLRANHSSQLIAETMAHEFALPEGLDIQITSLKFKGGEHKMRDNINRFLEEIAIQNLAVFATNTPEYTNLKEAVQATIKAYKDYMHEHGDGWLDAWSIQQIYTLAYQSESLLIVEFNNYYHWEINSLLPTKSTLFFDAQTGKNIAKEDLFKEKEKAIAFFQEALKTQLIVQQISPSIYEKFINNTELPFYIMYQKDNLHCIYTTIDGIPKDLGEIYLDISLADIMHLLKYL